MKTRTQARTGTACEGPTRVAMPLFGVAQNTQKKFDCKPSRCQLAGTKVPLRLDVPVLFGWLGIALVLVIICCCQSGERGTNIHVRV